MDWDSTIQFCRQGDQIHTVGMRDFLSIVDRQLLTEDMLFRVGLNGNWISGQEFLEKILSEFPDFCMESQVLRGLMEKGLREAEDERRRHAQALREQELEAARQRQEELSRLPHICPNCGSDNTAFASAIYAQGTTRTYVQTASGARSITQSTDFARQFAPPEGCQPGCLWLIFLFICFFLFLSGASPIHIIVGGFILLLVLWAVYFIAVQRPEIDKYKRTRHCFHCGCTYRK